MAAIKDEDKFLKIGLWIVASLSCAAIVFVLKIYFNKFNGKFGDQEVFGQFGDFIGGSVNPILSFFTVTLLILSIRVQLRELKLARIEFEKTSTGVTESATHQRDMLNLQRSTEERRELSDELAYHEKNLDKLIEEEAYSFYDEDVAIYRSFRFLIEYESILNGPYPIDVDLSTSNHDHELASFRGKLKNGKSENRHEKHTQKIRQEIRYIAHITMSLGKLLYDHNVKHGRYNRIIETLSKMRAYYLVSEEEYSTFVSLLNDAFYRTDGGSLDINIR